MASMTARLGSAWWVAPGQAAGHLVWPATCLGCGCPCSTDYGWLCQTCWQELLLCTGGTGCPLCGKDASEYALIDDACPNCLSDRPTWDGLCRCGVYMTVLRDLILSFKHGRSELDVLLAGLANAAIQSYPWYDQIELFVPVPLHWVRRLQRGYNQAAVIAKRLVHPKARYLNALRRTRWTAPQTSMSTPAARSRNVHGVFAIRRQVKEKAVCLVDDIKTTGATLSECTAVLRQAGARRVYVLVLAIA